MCIRILCQINTNLQRCNPVYDLDPTDPDSHSWTNSNNRGNGTLACWSPETRECIIEMNGWATQDKAREQQALREYMDMMDEYSAEDLGVGCIQEAMRKLKEEVGNN